ncbi:MAG: type I-E CRISPR-associated protein Cas7/Cse4/CasC [Phycisphaerae bacterium]|nr:type I-E CRISPR-associated protein Cas7/Cse4/CasC [Phycisphaerae bacterium]
MFVELHLLQNFAPSCLNRDDTNSPKDCEFGGYRRARISSQCIKRAIRRQFGQDGLLSGEELAHRSKRLVEEVARRLAESGKDLETAKKLVTAALAGVSLKVGDDGKTQYLLFMGENEIAGLVQVVQKHWDALEAAVNAAKPEDPENAAAKKKSAKQQKAAAKGTVPEEVREAVDKLLDGGKACDLALFGRMLADLPERNIDAACQVAHAISTNKVSVEMDYYTAVDDLKPEDTAGADMIGTVEFNSACFYRYANIDLDQLIDPRNLQGDEALARKTVEAFLRASVAAIPTGKQNSMAAHNPPSFVLAVVRDTGLWSLANAFVQPVQPRGNDDLVKLSIQRLDNHWGKLAKGFGDGAVKARPAFVLDEVGTDVKDRGCLSALKDQQVGTIDQLVEKVMATLAFTKDGARS